MVVCHHRHINITSQLCNNRNGSLTSYRNTEHYLLPKTPAITLQRFVAELKNEANSGSVTFPVCAFILFCFYYRQDLILLQLFQRHTLNVIQCFASQMFISWDIRVPEVENPSFHLLFLNNPNGKYMSCSGTKHAPGQLSFSSNRFTQKNLTRRWCIISQICLSCIMLPQLCPGFPVWSDPIRAASAQIRVLIRDLSTSRQSLEICWHLQMTEIAAWRVGSMAL